MNFLPLLVAAVVPLIFGFIWYNDKAFGNAWMKTGNLNVDDLKKGNMAILLGSVFLLCLLLAMGLTQLVVHQNSLPGLFNVKGANPSPDSPEGKLIEMFATGQYATLHRTFTHGMVHGLIYSILLVLPLIGINALFERRGWKYIMIHLGYWALTLMVMGGIICSWK